MLERVNFTLNFTTWKGEHWSHSWPLSHLVFVLSLAALNIVISSSVFQIISNLDELQDDMPDWEKELQAELQVMYFCKTEKFISTILWAATLSEAMIKAAFSISFKRQTNIFLQSDRF